MIENMLFIELFSKHVTIIFFTFELVNSNFRIINSLKLQYIIIMRSISKKKKLLKTFTTIVNNI